MKSNLGWTTVVLALATACGGATESTAGGSESGSDSSGTTGNSSSPTTGDPTASSNSNGGTTTGPTSGNSESNSGATDTTDTTAASSVSSVGESSDTSVSDTTSTPDTGTTGAPDTTSTGTVGDTTDGGTTMGVSASDTTDGGDGTTTGDEETTAVEEECGPLLDATIRDFSVQHPDFEKYGGNVAYKGLVLNDLGADNKPVYAAPGPTPQTSGPDAFNQWYNDTPNVNQAIQIQLMLTEVMPGIFRYQNDAFFPVDNQGFGNEGFEHNFAFTTEIHTQFVYNGGEVFTFIGDDDMWMFINKKLAIDLGGLHPPDTQTINLDAEAANLGIIPGGVYTMDIFHAERHSTGSNFRIDTTIGCFIPQ